MSPFPRPASGPNAPRSTGPPAGGPPRPIIGPATPGAADWSHTDAVESKLDRVIELLEQVLDPWCECGHRQTGHTDDRGVCAQWVEPRRTCVCAMFRKIVKL